MKCNQLLFACLSFSLLFSCENSISSVLIEDKVYITFSESKLYSSDSNSFVIDKGGNIEVTLYPEEGFSFVSCSYDDYDYVSHEDRSVDLTLKNVCFSQRVNLDFEAGSKAIIYDLNGGSFNSSAESMDHYVQFYSLEHHKRANTEIGTDRIHRDGYVLLGWNTSADGKGTHIGLGSRVTLDQETLTLYAEWVKESDPSYFETKTDADHVVFEKYVGPSAVDWLVLPHQFDGVKATSLSVRFLSEVKIENLVFSENITDLSSMSIVNCDIGNFYFSDSLTDCYEDSVTDGTYQHVYINANMAPRHQKDSHHVRFADNMDNLILTKGQKRLLCYAGCSMSYGLWSPYLEELLKDYQFSVLDLGVIGGTNASFAFDVMSNYVTSEDYFIHAPEVASPYQLMAKQDAESRMLIEVEGNYDLLSLSDMTVIHGFFGALRTFQNARLKLDPCTYEDYQSDYNDYGDIVIDRTGEGKTNHKFSDESEEYTYILDYTSEDAIKALAGKYDLLKSNGAKVLFSFSPVNYDGLSEESIENKIWEKFEENETSGLAQYGYQSISKAEDYLYGSEYFYDTDYHLNATGVYLRTSQLAKDLMEIL